MSKPAKLFSQCAPLTEYGPDDYMNQYSLTRLMNLGQWRGVYDFVQQLEGEQPTGDMDSMDPMEYLMLMEEYGEYF